MANEINLESKKMYGWVSKTKDKLGCFKVKYSTPDGGSVWCSMITGSDTDHRSNWNDAVCIGEVINFLESTVPPYRYRQGQPNLAERAAVRLSILKQRSILKQSQEKNGGQV